MCDEFAHGGTHLRLLGEEFSYTVTQLGHRTVSKAIKLTNTQKRKEKLSCFFFFFQHLLWALFFGVKGRLKDNSVTSICCAMRWQLERLFSIGDCKQGCCMEFSNGTVSIPSLQWKACFLEFNNSANTIFTAGNLYNQFLHAVCNSLFDWRFITL